MCSSSSCRMSSNSVAADVVADAFAMRDARRAGPAPRPFPASRSHCSDFLRVFADQQLAQILQVGQAFEEQDALDQLSACFISSIDSLYSCSASSLSPQFLNMRRAGSTG